MNTTSELFALQRQDKIDAMISLLDDLEEAVILGEVRDARTITDWVNDWRGELEET